MPSIYLIRHGQASFGQENYDQLSELGHQQAKHLGRSLIPRMPNIDHVSLGSLKRHHQTAETCLQAMNSPFSLEQASVDDGWNEYDHQNILAQFNPQFATAAGTQAFIAAQERPAQAFEEAFNRAVAQWMNATDESGYTETWRAYQSRVLAALKRLGDSYVDAKSILVFTSGGPISLISQSLLTIPENHLMRLNWTLVNCGITKLVKTPSRIFVSTLNEHGHFEGQHKHFITYR